MILRAKTTKALLTALFMAMALLLVLVPTGASAYLTRTIYWPYRGTGWFDKSIIYGKGYLDTTPGETYEWMEIHVYLYEEYPAPGMWWGRAEKVEGGEHIQSLGCKAQYTHPEEGTWMDTVQYEWDLDGASYQDYWMSSGSKYIPARS